MIGEDTFSMISDSTDAGSSPLLFSALRRKAASAWRKGSQGSVCEGNLSPVIPSQSFERTNVDENVININVPSESSPLQVRMLEESGKITYNSQADLFDSQKSSDHTDQLNKKMKLSEDSQCTNQPLIYIGSQSPGKLKTNTAHGVSGSQSVGYDKLLVEFPTFTQSFQALPDNRRSLQPIKLDDDAVSVFSTSTIPPVQDTYCPSGRVLLFSPSQSGNDLPGVPLPKNIHPCHIQNSSSSSSDITNPSMTSRNVCHEGSGNPSVGMAAQDITQSLKKVNNNVIRSSRQTGIVIHSSCKNNVDLPCDDNFSMKELNHSLHRNAEKSSASIVKSTKRSVDIVTTSVSAAVKMVHDDERNKLVDTQSLNCEDDGKRLKNSLKKEKVLLKSSQVHVTEVDTLNRLINLYKTTLEKIPQKKPTDKLLDKLQHITEKLIQTHKEERMKLNSFHTRSGHKPSKRYETLVKQLDERQALLHAAQSHHQELLRRISSLEDKDKPQRSIDIQFASGENIDESHKDITTKNVSIGPIGAKGTSCNISSSHLYNLAMKQPASQPLRASQSGSTGVGSVQLSSEEQEIHCLKASQNVDQNSHDQDCQTGSVHAEISLPLPRVILQTDTIVLSNSTVDETQLDLVKLSNTDSVFVKDHSFNKTELVGESLNLCLAGGAHKDMQTQMTQTCDLELFDSCSEGFLPRIAGISSVVKNKGLNSMLGLSQFQSDTDIVIPEIDHGRQKLYKEKHVTDDHVNEVETALIDGVVSADISCDMVSSRNRNEKNTIDLKSEPYKLSGRHLESLTLGSELECSTLGNHILLSEENKSKNQPLAVLSCMNYPTSTTQEVNINAANKIKGDVITPNKSANHPPSPSSTNSSSLFPVSSKELKRRIESRVANLNKSVSLPLSLNNTNPTDRSVQQIVSKPFLADYQKMVMKNSDLKSSKDNAFMKPRFSPQFKTQQLEVSPLSDHTMTHSQRPVTTTSVLARKTTVKEKPCRKKGRPKKCDKLKGDNLCSSKKSKKNVQISIKEYFPIVNEHSSVQCADTLLGKNSVRNELLVLGKNSEQKEPVVPFKFTDHKKTDVPKSLDTSEQTCISVSYNSGRAEVPTPLATVVPISTIKSIQTIQLIADSEVTNTSQDFPDSFWEENFADISMSKAFWDSVDVW